MTTKAQTIRKAQKAHAIIKRLEEMHESRAFLIPMLPEERLDLLIIALGLGEVQLRELEEPSDDHL